MPKGKVLNLSKYRVLEFLKKNLFSIIGFAFLTVGVILGLSLFDDFKIIPEYLNGYFSSYIGYRNSSGFFAVSFKSFLSSLYLFLIIYVFGTTIFGVVTVPICVTLFGFFYGAAVAFLYSEYALKGVAFNAMIFLPSNLILLLFIIFASRYAMIFSLDIAKLTLPNGISGDLSLQFKEYSLRILVLTLGGLLAALIDGLTSSGLLKFFEF